MWFIAGLGWHFQMQDKEPGSWVFFFVILFYFVFFTRRGQILHSYSRISPVKKGQRAYLARRGESRRLGLKGVRGTVLENRGGRLQLDKDPRSTPWTRIISHLCQWLLCMYIYYLVKDSHLLKKGTLKMQKKKKESWRCTLAANPAELKFFKLNF